MKIKSFPSIAFFFSAFLFAFLFDVHLANAEGGLFSFITDPAGDAFFYVINIVLYAVFTFVSYPVTWSAMIFGLTVDPAAVNTMFTMDVIYTLWQMIRDFFNLFFILTLLFIAFATIFQIDSFNYKKTLGKLLLMALLVNFSFPVTRFIIDTANVPMYFFMESVFSDKTQAKAENVTNRFLGVSKITELILGKADFGVGDIKGDSDITTKLLVGIVFMFLFGVSLFVLALMFLIRSIMLVLLIIFSPVGFVGKVIPGFSKYASEWWDALLRYAFFGPAAMLMILVSLKFLEGFTGAGGMGGPAAIAGQSSAAPGNTYLGSMVAIMAPLIMIWMSITVGQKMGIHGASEVTGRAQQFSKWAGRKGAKGLGYTGLTVGTLGAMHPGRAKAVAAGAQEGWKNFAKTGKAFGKNVAVPFSQDAQEDRNAKYGAFAKGGRSGMREDVRSRLHAKQKAEVDEAAKKYAIGGTMTDTRLQDLHKQARSEKDKVLLAATTKEMSKRESTAKDVSADDMKAINAQFAAIGGVRSAVADEVKEEVAKKNAAVAYENDESAMAKAFAGGKIKIEDQTANGLTTELIQAANTAGKLDQKILEEMRKDSEKKRVLDSNLIAATKATEAKYQADVAAGTTITDDQTKARTRMHQLHVAQTGDFHGDVISDIALQNSVFKKADAGTLKNMSPALMGHYRDQIADNMQIGKITNAVSEISETNDVAAQALVNELKAIKGTNARAQKAVDALQRDHRTGAFV